jgi:hypothetical protein
MLRKQISFEHEHEVRGIFWKPVNPPDTQPPGLGIAADLAVLIESIVIAPQAQPWFAEVVRELTSRFGLSASATFSPLADEPFWG